MKPPEISPVSVEPRAPVSLAKSGFLNKTGRPLLFIGALQILLGTLETLVIRNRAVAHSFLLEPGKWTLQGTWLTRETLPTPVKGKLLVAWKQDNCFMVATKLTFPEGTHKDIVIQLRGRMTSQERQYTFVVQHNLLGQVEGEGWIAPESIVQRYWGLSDKQRRTGFETLRQLSPEKYHFSGGMMAGHYLTSTIEAELARQ